MKFSISAVLALLGVFGGIGAANAQDKPYAALVQSIVASELQVWIDDQDLIYAIKEQNEINAGMSPLMIEALDRRWIEQDQ